MKKCKNCDIVTNNPKFCSRSCSVTYNNMINPKRSVLIESINKVTCKCGGKKALSAEMCQSCRNDITLNKPISEIKRKSYPHWNMVRAIAKRIMKNSNNIKTCYMCGHNEFDSVVEVCHIKEITSFDENTLVKEVNALENLVYLCPSHHRLLDKGSIKL